ncbi:MAG: glutamine--fructose-6-phosphate transaminase (isomerizing) [Euzebyales bacterium]|nr:glutamine--fructose-6-phosphate transaminase (isomerizing) [Euzebyales bacterium]
MCGIIGYTGHDQALPVLLAGLATLEYRGYDSAGVVVATSGDGRLEVVKRAGKLSNLVAAVRGRQLTGTSGLGHTRWATHGEPTDSNAHPHTDASGDLAVIHNGIFENYARLKAELVEAGHDFTSDTDTEVVAHLIGALREEHGGDLAAALRAALRRVHGAFALAVIDRHDPTTIVAARREAPLILGHGDGANLLASDVAGVIAHTRDITALLDDQVAVLTPGGLTVTDLDGNPAEGHRYTVDWDVSAAEKQGYTHFMLKEIHEQPRAVAETLMGRLDDQGRVILDALPGGPEAADQLRHIDKVYVVACGTSYHAGMVAKYVIEHWARIPVEVEIASEFRYRDPILTPHTLVVAVSQSGETADTIAAAVHARDQQAKVVSVTNVVGSSLAREADAVLYTRAGPEIAVASTKATTTQIVALDVLALYLAQQRRALFPDECRDHLARMAALPALIEQVLQSEGAIAALAEEFAGARYVMFFGRHVGLPIALIEEGGPVVALATRGHVRGKVVNNIKQVKGRGAVVLAIATEGDTEIKEHADHVLYVPEVHELLYPILTVVPLQLLSYFIAVALGRDIDQPRNLAKTVTVE